MVVQIEDLTLLREEDDESCIYYTKSREQGDDLYLHCKLDPVLNFVDPETTPYTQRKAGVGVLPPQEGLEPG